MQGLAILFGSFASFCPAQQLLLPTGGIYSPGRYVPLKIDITAPGIVHIRGEGVQGIDLPAAGRGSVIVPLMIWRISARPLDLLVNGNVQRLTIQPLGQGDSAPPLLTSFWIRNDPDHSVDPQSAMIDENAYENLDLWNPGRSYEMRLFVLRAGMIGVLLLGAGLHARQRPSLVLMAGIAIGVIAVVRFTLPVDSERTEIAATNRPPRIVEDAPQPTAGQPVWVWRATAQPQTITESFGKLLWFIPRSDAQLRQASPILECDASGQPQRIRLNLITNDRAAFFHIP